MSDLGQLFRLLFIVLVILVINGIKRAGRDAKNRRPPPEPGDEPSPADVFRSRPEALPLPVPPKRRPPAQRPAGAAARRPDTDGEGSRRRSREERGDEEGPAARRRLAPRGHGEGRAGSDEGSASGPAIAAHVPRAAVSRSREPTPPSRAHRLIAKSPGGVRRALLLGEILGPPGGRS